MFRASLTALEECNLPAAGAQSIFKKQPFWRAEKEVAAIRRVRCRVVHWHELENPQAFLRIYDARGVDAIAHEGATAVRGRAIGDLGTGIDVCYPKENKKLYVPLGVVIVEGKEHSGSLITARLGNGDLGARCLGFPGTRRRK